MNISIKTAYRIVKKYQEGKDPIYVPQYQDEEGDKWHNFTIPVRGRSGGRNTIYFNSKPEAMDFLDQQWAKEEVVVYYEDLIEVRLENAS